MARKLAEDIHPGDRIYAKSRRRWVTAWRVRYTHDARPPYQVIVELQEGGSHHFNWDEHVEFRSGGG
jgi:hypothetical protein